MAALNRVQIIGNLGADPKTREISRDRKVTSFRVAVNRRWRNANKEIQEETMWFSVEAWAGLGDVCARYLKKGRSVYVEGRLKINEWDDTEGGHHERTVVVARDVQFLGEVGRSETQIEEPETSF